jgi:hypothetical protein
MRLEGDHWMAAEHVPRRRFHPGPHFVRVEVESQLLAEVTFEIEGEAGLPETPEVSGFRFVSATDGARRRRARTVTTLPVGTNEIHCAFSVSAAAPGTDVEVRWFQGGHRISVTDLGHIEGRRPLSASLSASRELPAGYYRVQVVLGRRVAHVQGIAIVVSRGARSPRISNLVLTTSIHPRSRRPTGPRLTALEGDEGTIFLCLSFSGMPRGETLEVRWFQDTHLEEPMAASTFEVAGRGSLAASFTPDGALPPGRYHVEVMKDDSVLGGLEFTVGPEEEWPETSP